MREWRREAVWCRQQPLAAAPCRKEYLRERLSEPSRLCAPSDSRGAGMSQARTCLGLTRVAGFHTASDRLLHPYATRAKAGHERPGCPRPARQTAMLDSTTVVHATVNRGVPGSNPGRAALFFAALDGSGVFSEARKLWWTISRMPDKLALPVSS